MSEPFMIVVEDADSSVEFSAELRGQSTMAETKIIQSGWVGVIANKGYWQQGPTIPDGVNAVLALSMPNKNSLWEIIDKKQVPAWGDGFPGGDRFVAPGVSQGALLIRDASGRIHPCLPPSQQTITIILQTPGVVTFIANDEQPHDGYNGFADNVGEQQVQYQLEATVPDNYPSSQVNYPNLP